MRSLICLILAVVGMVGIFSTDLSAQDLSAQYYTLSGTIFDENDKPLEGASIFIRETYHATITDRQGKFVLDSLDAGVNVLVCTHLGYKRVVEYVDMDNDISIDIFMENFSYDLDAIMITSNRLEDNEPFAYSTVTKEEIEVNNLGQDLPFLLQYSPSIVASSDAGAGIGYTGLRIRGSDPTRINVSINGIPLNDSESQAVFWVNTPDFSSSVDDIQIQRGVGTSTSGTGAFGGTIGINTHKISKKNYLEVNSGVGSFGTRKINARLGTGLLNNTFFIDGRVSFINSDGFIDRAESNLRSYYISVGKLSDNSTLRFDYFSGVERTYQAWNGVPQAKFEGDNEALITHYNNNIGFLYNNVSSPLDLHLDANNLYFSHNVQDSVNLFSSENENYNYYTFDEEVDRYQQDHYQFHWGTNKDLFESNVSLHYTRGQGYFEQFKFGENLGDYGLNNIVDTITQNQITSANLVRRKWLKNDYFGGVANLKWTVNDNVNVHWGTAYHVYRGNHNGNIQAWDIRSSLDQTIPYYNNDGAKNDGSTFIKLNYRKENLGAFADFQYRNVRYSVLGLDDDGQTHDFIDRLNFFNPKLGLSYMLSQKNQVYLSAAVGNREPDRSDYLNFPEGTFPKSERLIDYELGLRSRYEKIAGGLNFYYMDYKDQLVITGELNDVGGTLRQNVPESFRAGIEAEIGWDIHSKLNFYANATLSQNKIKNFEEILPNYDTGTNDINNYQNTDIALSPNAIAALNLTYKPLEDAYVGFQSKYVGQQFLDNTSNLDRSLDAYLVSSIVAGYDLPIKQLKSCKIRAQINNVFNEKYASNGYSYSYTFGSLITENFVYPQAGLNWLIGLTIGI